MKLSLILKAVPLTTVLTQIVGHVDVQTNDIFRNSIKVTHNINQSQPGKIQPQPQKQPAEFGLLKQFPFSKFSMGCSGISWSFSRCQRK